MAKLKFTLNKLAKHGFKFTKNTTYNSNPSHDLYYCKFKDGSALSFYTNLDGTVSGFQYSHSNGESPSYYTSINAVIHYFLNKL